MKKCTKCNSYLTYEESKGYCFDCVIPRERIEKLIEKYITERVNHLLMLRDRYLTFKSDKTFRKIIYQEYKFINTMYKILIKDLKNLLKSGKS